MNSPDYNDYIDMFNVATPMASPSHEVMYDSLPPWSNLPDSFSIPWNNVNESSLKEPVDSKPPVFSKSPDHPPSKRLIQSFIVLCDPRNKGLRRNDSNEGHGKRGMRNEGMYQRQILGITSLDDELSERFNSFETLR
ncbi:hypothetical protein TNCV_737631 [Trichonephila clavipes]|nr:hypothetical protein TNCV_737631 [Trichonephila clavipes]